MTREMRVATGRLLFEQKVNGQDKPMRHFAIQLKDDDAIKDDVLANGHTDKDGYFRLEYDPKQAGFLDTPDLKLEVFLHGVRYVKAGEDKSPLVAVRGYKAKTNDDVDSEKFDFGDIRVALMEYADPATTATPRLLVDDDHKQQQQYKPGRILEFVDVAKNIPIFNLTGWPQTKIQKLGDEAYTEPFFTDVALNGFNPVIFKKSKDGKSLYSEYSWNGYTQDGKHFAPNTIAHFDAKTLAPTSISVQRRVGQFIGSRNAALEEPKVYTPASDGDAQTLWQNVKRVWRCNYFLWGEGVTHLGQCHLNLEQYIIPVVRNLQHNPIRALLTPHFNGTLLINYSSDAALTGPDGAVTNFSAATRTTLQEMVRGSFGGFNWFGFKPRTPLSAGHRFAHAGNLFWDVLTKYVDYFFEKNKADIKEHWPEMHQLSEELLLHSVPFVQSEEDAYYCTNEINMAHYPHPVVNGIKTAVSPITHSDTCNDADFENAKQLCRYIIYWSTFAHTWVNDIQYDFSGDSDYVSIGLSTDITNLENDIKEKAVLPDARAAMRQTTYVLSNVKYGYIMKDEDKDINPKLKELLRAKEQAFKALGVNIDEIRSRINI